MSQKQTPKQGNTLFSYFTKTPKKEPTPSKCTEVLSPRRSPNKSSSPKSFKTSPSTPKGGKGACGADYASGDVVWAKLEGYPWWPSLVCDHPTKKTHLKAGKKAEVHVQFFDTPPTRAWIKASYVKPFQGSDGPGFQRGGQFYTLNTQIRKGAEDADKAMKMTVDDRLKLVAELLPSDSEEEEEEDDDGNNVQMMDLDPDIFDDEMSEENDDSIKENKETAEEKVAEKTSPSKKETPSKKRTRNAARGASKPKRRRIITPDSAEEDSEEDFKPSGSEDDDSASSGVDEDDVSEPESESGPETPVKTPQRKKGGSSMPKKATPATPATPASSNRKIFTPLVSSSTKSKLSLFSAPDADPASGDAAQTESTQFVHNKLDFLKAEHIRDANKKRPTDPDYDPRTLLLPSNFLDKQTPAMRQWWDLKCKHFDTILFFKMGKFYELFHMDSSTGVEELGLMYMKGEYAHSGFPEIAYSRYADALMQKGYKVARIEQTETPDMMADRCREMSRPTKFDKVVKREICQVSSQGIRTFSQRDGDVGEAPPSYLLALCETESQDGVLYGVCFVDTSIGTFHVGQFSDDRHCSRLRTVLAHHTPAQILYERGRMSARTMQLIGGHAAALKEALSPAKEFWDSGKTLKTLLEEDYFRGGEDKEFEWPPAVKAMMSDSDSLGLTAADGYDLAVRSLGAIVWYLQYCLMDQEVLSLKKFQQYQPLDKAPETSDKTTFNPRQRNMVLDGVTLFNLEVTENAVSGGPEGTLLERLDTCSTPFGKRLLKQWVCAPLCQPDSISDRLDAVETLMTMQDVATETSHTLNKMPDLERLLYRIHSLGSAKRANHPEGRAIMYEDVTYSKRKIEDFLSTLAGFKSAMKIAGKFSQRTEDLKSKLLKQTVLLDSQPEGHFPDLTDDLKFFEEAFNQDKARKEGVIVPNKGVDEDYDEAVTDMRATETQLQDYLDTQRQRLGCKMMVYWGTGKSRYQLEVPEAATKRVPQEYEVMSSKKGAKRYRTKVIEGLLGDLGDAEERRDAALKDIMRRIFHSFDQRHARWSQAVACLSVLDVLLALAKYSHCSDGVMCRPCILPPSADNTPSLEIRDGRHPCIGGTFVGSDFIPNDTVIGVKDESDATGAGAASRVVMVTGPNMGGKSTLMRQTGLVVILAQLGCYVPAEVCRLTPVDRIFTRLGASDRIMSGESTFFVELSETSAILQHATEHSLVLMDELGRGTATYDGTAIAYAVVRELSDKLHCRSLFSTHYHSLVQQFEADANVRTGHMACMVENDDEGDSSQETITFLYKFVHGACPKSYGFNAARLAGIPEEIIRSAVKKSKEFESNVEQLRLFGKLCRNCTSDNVKEVLAELEAC